jgi:O-antigen/teichoic acid export membrane protein
LGNALIWGGVMLFFSTLNGVQIGILSGLEQFRIVAKLTAMDSVLTLLVATGGAWYFGVNGAIAGAAAALIITYPFKRKYVQEACTKSDIPINYKISLKESSPIIKFVIPSIAVGLSAQPFDWLARYILLKSDNGFSELGLFSVASTLAQFVLFIPNQFSGPTQPILANLVGMNQSERIKRVLVKVSLIVGSFGIGGALVVIVFSELIVSMYGTQYTGAVQSLKVLALSSVLCSLSQIPKNYLYAQNMVWQVVWAHIIMGVVLCLGVWLLQQHSVVFKGP